MTDEQTKEKPVSTPINHASKAAEPSELNRLREAVVRAERAAKEAEIACDHRERQIVAIRRTSDAVFTHSSVDAMVRETLEIALDVLGADAGSVFLHDDQNDTLVFRYVIGGAGETLIGKVIPASQGVAGTVFKTGESVIAGDIQERGDFNPDVDRETGYETRSMMTVPVKRSGGAPIGVMQVLNAHNPPFKARDLEVLQALCAQAATGIEHARLVEEARKAEIVNVIGDISHDIKNMLTPIMTGAWTLEPLLDRLFEDLDGVRAKCADTETLGADIEFAANAVRKNYRWMLQDVVAFAEQVQARTKEIADAVKGEMAPPFFERGNLNDTCRVVAKHLEIVAQKASVALVLDFDDELPPVEFDHKQVYNAVYNLVNNAIPETPSGGTITIQTRRSATDKDSVTMSVQDTGKGIPEAVRARLFTDAAVSTKPGGTGLGTRIVAGVVRRHNGTITVDSSEGVGSTFTIRLPIRHTT